MLMLRRTDPVAHRLVALGVTPSAADRLSRGGTLLDLPAGTTLCAKGERGTQAFYILDGTAHVLLDDRVVEIGAGDVTGELAALDPHATRNATVVAHTDLVALVYDVPTFRSLAIDEALRDVLVPTREAA
jgi:CRP-like cAMP-binding protein